MINLLKKIELINYKYSLIDAENQFNIFGILRNKYDEVNLHSQFICELLQKNGSHKYGLEITKSFLNTLGIEDFKLDKYTVYKEYQNIDILITNDKQAIIIENKIWANDQAEQLQRYSKIIEGEYFEDIYIFYLTPFGKEPSKSSLGTLKLQKEKDDEKIEKGEVILISYSFHILNWIESCIKITATHPALREATIQYQQLINDLTGKSSNMEKRMEIYNLLSEGNNIENAFTIAQNWNHIRWHTEWDFWTCFEEKIKKENYIILDNQKFSIEKLNSVIHQSRNRKSYYGLKFELSEFKGKKVYLMIERGFGQVIYGIKTDNENVEELSKLIQGFSEFNVMGNWTCRNHFNPSIDFEAFSNKATLYLSNYKVRVKRVEEYWVQVKGLVDHYENTMSKL